MRVAPPGATCNNKNNTLLEQLKIFRSALNLTAEYNLNLFVIQIGVKLCHLIEIIKYATEGSVFIWDFDYLH